METTRTGIPHVKAILTHAIPCFHSTESFMAEKFFESLALDKGWKVVKATSYQDTREHWDFMITSPNHVEFPSQWLVDVKSTKNMDGYVWVELSRGTRVVKGGHVPVLGWLFDSKANIIAFESPEDFILVEREKLLQFVNNTVDRDSFVSEKSSAVNKVYKRKRKRSGLSVEEELTLLEIGGIRKIAWDIWSKPERMKPADQAQCQHGGLQAPLDSKYCSSCGARLIDQGDNAFPDGDVAPPDGDGRRHKRQKISQ